MLKRFSKAKAQRLAMKLVGTKKNLQETPGNGYILKLHEIGIEMYTYSNSLYPSEDAQQYIRVQVYNTDRCSVNSFYYDFKTLERMERLEDNDIETLKKEYFESYFMSLPDYQKKDVIHHLIREYDLEC